MLGQLTSANLSGQVTDDSGAAIPDPTVTIVDTSTGATSHAQTDSQGAYVITGLAPRVYRLTFTRKGFDSYTQEGLTIGVGQHATINAQLHVGSVNQSVTVQADTAAVNLQSPTSSYEIDNKMTQELPPNGRNVLQLMQIAPDAGPTQSTGYQQGASRPDQTNSFAGASGGRGDSTAFYLDGALNEDVLTQIANIFPNPDAIQEFSFDTSTYRAKFGAVAVV